MPFPLNPNESPYPSAPPAGESWVYGQPVPPPPGPPLAPPMPPNGSVVSPAPPLRAQRARSWGPVAVTLVVVLLVGAVAGGVASRALRLSISSTPLANAGVSDSGVGVAPGSDPQGLQGGGGSAGGTSGSASPPLASWTEVASAVDPGVVDIESRMAQGVGAGTGMVLTATGEILTNNHVVDGATQIVVTVSSTGRTYSADVVGTDPAHDVAVLQMRGASGLATIPLGNSDAVNIGDQVAAIGNAGGQGGIPTLASGQVTALHQQITASNQDGSSAETLSDLIQVAATVVPGDSGGPLANNSGQVIGMDTAASSGVGSRGGPARLRAEGKVGFAIPINQALAIANQLESGSPVPGSQSQGSGAFLGVEVRAGTSGEVEIVGVQSASPAAAAGWVAGDIIVGIGGSTVNTPDDLVSALADHQPGDRVTFAWHSPNSPTQQADVTLASR